ncbi:DciA family protein [Luteimonas sp. A478]
MSRFRSHPRRPSRPAKAALDALLADGAGDPVRRAMWLETMDRRLHSLLPPTLAARARLGNVDGKRLVYLVESPIWHARLRLAGPEILAAARSIGLDVTEFVVKTTRPVPRAPRPRAAMRSLSPHAEQALREVVATLSDDGTGKDTS